MKVRSTGYSAPGKTFFTLEEEKTIVSLSMEHKDVEDLVIALLRNLSYMDQEWKGLHTDAAHLYEAKRREAKRAARNPV